MVVLLAIAGTVAAVLFNRASDVTGELDAQDVTRAIDTKAECENHEMGTVKGVWATNGSKCTWTDPSVTDDQVTNGACLLVDGNLTTDGRSGFESYGQSRPARRLGRRSGIPDSLGGRVANRAT